MFAYNNFPFRAFVTMIYRTLTEMLLNLVAPLDSLDFEQINVFWTLPVLIPLVLYLIRLVSAEVTLNCISRIRFSCSSSDVERINIWLMALTPLALHSFPYDLLSFSRRLPKSCYPLNLDLSSFDFEWMNPFCLILGQISAARSESWYRKLKFCFFWHSGFITIGFDEAAGM